MRGQACSLSTACSPCIILSPNGPPDLPDHAAIRVQRLSKYVQRELSLHSELSHPFVIGFKRVFFTTDFLVFVLEYASEGSLARFRWPATYAQRKPLAIYFFQQLIAAVKYCHEHEIVHRDLKHENTLLHMAVLPSGNSFLALKVADFGMCKAAMHSDPKTRVGTIPYMSPVRAAHLSKCIPAISRSSRRCLWRLVWGDADAEATCAATLRDYVLKVALTVRHDCVRTQRTPELRMGAS